MLTVASASAGVSTQQENQGLRRRGLPLLAVFCLYPAHVVIRAAFPSQRGRVHGLAPDTDPCVLFRGFAHGLYLH